MSSLCTFHLWRNERKPVLPLTTPSGFPQSRRSLSTQCNVYGKINIQSQTLLKLTTQRSNFKQSRMKFLHYRTLWEWGWRNAGIHSEETYLYFEKKLGGSKSLGHSAFPWRISSVTLRPDHHTRNIANKNKNQHLETGRATLRYRMWMNQDSH